MGEVVYTSRVEIVREKGPVRRATLPQVDKSVTFGVHSEIADHYGVPADAYPPDATTLDYVVAAAGG